MGNSSKLNKLLTTDRAPGEVQDWLFSLTPIGVAFCFYLIFIMQANIEPKGIFVAYGAAAGFIGLESYWIIRGWRKNHVTTVVLGVLGIVVALSLLALYSSIV